MARKFRKREPKPTPQEPKRREAEPEVEFTELKRRSQNLKRRRRSAPQSKLPSPKTFYLLGGLGFIAFFLAWTALATSNASSGNAIILPTGLLFVAGSLLFKWISAERKNTTSRFLVAGILFFGSIMVMGFLVGQGRDNAQGNNNYGRTENRKSNAEEYMTAFQCLQKLKEIPYPSDPSEKSFIEHYIGKLNREISMNDERQNKKVLQKLLPLGESAPHPLVCAYLNASAVNLALRHPQFLDQVLPIFEKNVQLRLSGEETSYPIVMISANLLSKLQDDSIKKRVIASLIDIVAHSQESQDIHTGQSEGELLLQHDWLPSFQTIFPKLDLQKQKRLLQLTEEFEEEERLIVLKLIAQSPDFQDEVFKIVNKLAKGRGSGREKCLKLAMNSPSLKVRRLVFSHLKRLWGYREFRRMIRTMTQAETDPVLKAKLEKLDKEHGED